MKMLKVEKEGQKSLAKTATVAWRYLFLTTFLFIGISIVAINPDDFTNLIRAIEFGLTAELMILIGSVLLAYSKTVPNASGFEKSLPWHILLIGASYILLLIAILFDVIRRFGNEMPLTITNGGILLIALLLGIFAMGFMLRYQLGKRMINQGIELNK